MNTLEERPLYALVVAPAAGGDSGFPESPCLHSIMTCGDSADALYDDLRSETALCEVALLAWSPLRGLRVCRTTTADWAAPVRCSWGPQPPASITLALLRVASECVRIQSGERGEWRDLSFAVRYYVQQ